MSPDRPRSNTMSLDMLEAKIKVCEARFREYQREREERRRSSASSLGASALGRTIRAEESFEDNPNIVLGYD